MESEEGRVIGSGGGRVMPLTPPTPPPSGFVTPGGGGCACAGSIRPGGPSRLTSCCDGGETWYGSGSTTFELAVTTPPASAAFSL